MPSSMSHIEHYKENQQYAEFLASWDPNFYNKYCDAIKPFNSGKKILDVGCGVGQVVQKLTSEGYDAYGVDVSYPNIQLAKKVSEKCMLYDGKSLPFEDSFFDSVGAINVLEHVEEPEAFLLEMLRVTRTGGKIVVSSPNFFRVIGFNDYHPHMRGLKNKLNNFKRILTKYFQIKNNPGSIKFDRMEPIIKEPFTPDDDAIIATNPLEIAALLKYYGCKILKVECTDRYVFKPLDFLLNVSPLKYIMLNGFVIAKKITT